MKKIYFLFILFFPTFFLFAQNKTKEQDTIGLTDREILLKQLDTSKYEIEKVNILVGLSSAYKALKPDSSLLLSREALNLSVKIGYREGVANALYQIARTYAYTGNYTSALQLYFQSLKIYDSLRIPEWTASNYLQIGETYNYLGDYYQSITYSYHAKKISDSIQYYPVIAWALLNMGLAYEEMNNLDSALLCTNQSAEIAKQNKVPRIKGRIFSYLGNIYLKKDSADLAMFYYTQSLPILDSLLDNLSLCKSWIGISRIYEKKSKPDSALYYAEKSLTTAKKGGFLFQVLDASNFISNHYKRLNNLDSAFIYQQISVAARDSLFNQEKIMQFQSIVFTQQMEQQKAIDEQQQYKRLVQVYILIAGLAVLLLLAIILLRNNRNKQRANSLLQRQKKEIDFQKEEVEKAFYELKATQKQLVQSEKMASLGELTAGIAHEIQNPLNFVNNFSEVNNELIQELKAERSKLNAEQQEELLNDIAQNNEKINHHGKRADAIVKGMLQHSRTSTGSKEPTNINALCDEYLRLSYHGLRAKDKMFNAKFETDFDNNIQKVNIVAQDIGRVILNLINNAFYAVNEKKKVTNEDYQPTVIVSTKKAGNKIEIKVKDNGNGVPQKIVDKIFQPFFTTKPTGQGTGLGLSLSYDIIKAHGGEIKVETKEGEGSEFIIQLPVS